MACAPLCLPTCACTITEPRHSSTPAHPIHGTARQAIATSQHRCPRPVGGHQASAGGGCGDTEQTDEPAPVHVSLASSHWACFKSEPSGHPGCSMTLWKQPASLNAPLPYAWSRYPHPARDARATASPAVSAGPSFLTYTCLSDNSHIWGSVFRKRYP